MAHDRVHWRAVVSTVTILRVVINACGSLHHTDKIEQAQYVLMITCNDVLKEKLSAPMTLRRLCMISC